MVIQVSIAASTTALHAMTVRRMPIRSDDPLRRVTLYLYEEDCAALETGHGHGWTTRIREILHENTWYLRKYQPRKTLGDLTDDE